jgi:cytoskeletal protein CcmA (bactofilin family)
MPTTSAEPVALNLARPDFGGNSWNVRACVLAGACLLFLLLSGQTRAFEARSGDVVSVAAGETVTGDLYLAGNQMLIEGTVDGDVVAAGRTFTVNGVITGDLIVGAQTVTVNGTVGESVRSAAYSLVLTDNAAVTGDLVAAGYSLSTAAGSQVETDLVFGGRQALLAGTVSGDAMVGAVGLELRGEINGSLTATLAEPGTVTPRPPGVFGLPALVNVPAGLTLADDARIGGDLQLTTPAPAAVRPEIVEGETSTSISRNLVARQSIFLQLTNRFLVLLAVGLLLLWLTPGLLRRATSLLQKQPLRDLGWGALLLIGVPLVLPLLLGVVILLAVLFGVIPLGGLAGFVAFAGLFITFFLAALFVLLALFIAPAVAAYAGGQLLLPGSTNHFLALLVGVLLVVLLSAIPVVGGLIALLVVAFGLGLLLAGRPRQRSTRVEAPR